MADDQGLRSTPPGSLRAHLSGGLVTVDCEHGYRAAGGTADCPACGDDLPSSQPNSVLVSFDAELRLIGGEVPETLDADALAQAVQDSIGYSGVKVSDVFDWKAENLA